MHRDPASLSTPVTTGSAKHTARQTLPTSSLHGGQHQMGLHSSPFLTCPFVTTENSWRQSCLTFLTLSGSSLCCSCSSRALSVSRCVVVVLCVFPCRGTYVSLALRVIVFMSLYLGGYVSVSLHVEVVVVSLCFSVAWQLCLCVSVSC